LLPDITLENVPATTPYSPPQRAQDQFVNAAFSASTSAHRFSGDTHHHTIGACSYLAASCSDCPLTSLNLSPTPGFLYHAGSFALHPRKGCAIAITQVGQIQQDPHCTSLPPSLLLRGPRSQGNEQIARVARHGHLQAS
jgi:hypothetical protein